MVLNKISVLKMIKIILKTIILYLSNIMNTKYLQTNTIVLSNTKVVFVMQKIVLVSNIGNTNKKQQYFSKCKYS